jgi:hypothetical protein
MRSIFQIINVFLDPFDFTDDHLVPIDSVIKRYWLRGAAGLFLGLHVALL